MTFEQMWRELRPIGRNPRSGGYVRSPFASAERECAAWYVDQATRRDLDVDEDGQGNAVAWWRPAGRTARGILVGSHLDSVDDGGAFDGPLGVVSSFAAIDALRDSGFIPGRPIGVAMFVGEEGSRFGLACLGSRLATGLTEPGPARELRDGDGVFLLDAMASAGLEPRLGRSGLLDQAELFIELHVEQGRDLVHRGRAVAVASAGWAHGRWRFDFAGEANHAGATRMEDRRDPTLSYAMAVIAAGEQAAAAKARATFGRVVVQPNVTNAIPSHVAAWLDARGVDADAVARLVEAIERRARQRADHDGTTVSVTTESTSPSVEFDPILSARLARILGDAPLVPTAAGHDAAILQLAGIPSAMLFVRNPTGVSHSPEEFAETADCLAGVDALTRVLRELAA